MEFKYLLLYSLDFLAAIGYSIIAPLYPSVAKSKGVSDTTIGIIFSLFSLAMVIINLSSNYLLQRYSRKNLIFYCVIGEGLGMIIFGSLEYLNNVYLFIFLSAIIRFIQGFTSSLAMILIYSIALSYSDDSNIKTIIAYLEIMYYIGYTVGPIVASIFYGFGGYIFPFLVIGGVILICSLFIVKLDVVEEENYKEISLLETLKNGNILINFLTLIMLLSANTFFLPLLSEYLQMKFGMSIQYASFFFVISIFSYFSLVPWINEVTNYLGLKYSIFDGLILIAVSLILIPPISILPQFEYVIITGLLILGVGTALVQVPCYLNFINTLKNENSLDEGISNDISSTLYILGINIGDTLGPIIGVTLTASYGYESCFLIMSFVCTFYALIVLLINHVKFDQNKMPLDNEKGLEQPLVDKNNFDEVVNENKL